MLPRILAGALALTFATACGAECRVAQAELPVRIDGRRPIATLKLNGTEVQMLVDSGAFFSVLSPATAEQLKLQLRRLPDGLRISGYTGRIDAKMTRVDKVSLLGAELRDVEFLVGGNALNAGIQGVLGRNFLSMADTEYDLARGVVRISVPKGDCEETNLAHWAGEAPVVVVPLSDRNERNDAAPRVVVRINGRKGSALLDTGAPSSALTLKAALDAGIEERQLTPAGRAGGAGAGRVKSWIGNVASFEIGGEKISNSRLEINDTEWSADDMRLGLDYFLSHRIYVSKLQRKIYITWNGNPVFALNREVSAQTDMSVAAAAAPIADTDSDGLMRRGAAALARRDPTRALEDLNRACALAPAVAGCFFTRAMAHLELKHTDAALADLDAALRVDAAHPEARLRRAMLRASRGDRPGAQSDLAQLDAELPPSASQRAAIGRLYGQFGQVPEALRQFELWVAVHRKDIALPSVLNARCWLRARMNIELPQALQDCENAVDGDEDQASYRDSLGWTYLRLGDAKRARKAFDGAIERKPRAFSHFGRALALRRLQETAASERDLAIARALDPGIDAAVRREGFEFAEELGPVLPATLATPRPTPGTTATPD